ncbi:MAG: AbrB/MazE/SpoVT family DNA-binding domain-containing protein [Methylovulum sp.]|uniref:AbrB/MazE/SpoVT family DNA-binding domain-containing protein n=1 Tax=Methylovulum sp. TaxID=1916980 RepID=UPI002620D55C|nr:AbrB/MazE/SpoVT family DNA-binding domain-containing protein [Methylovulum sp.]MDD2724844.1 AbrB/MazE/SpoVT family DNA-binding domain-containing protein [Methylovulum sp.]MDD5124944.1 AbrB/MazE/SpoVT family DNA-binding domain-containing protein [Methylovulum sp.]
MTTVSISPQGQITLPNEVLKIDAWQNNKELTLICLGDTVILRPAHYQKTDDISDLGGFFKNNPIKLNTESLCEPVNLTEA